MAEPGIELTISDFIRWKGWHRKKSMFKLVVLQGLREGTKLSSDECMVQFDIQNKVNHKNLYIPGPI